MKKGRIYTVHYGEETKITEIFISSTIPFLGNSLDLVIINNTSTIEIANRKSNFIHIINSNNNLGYFGGIKFGMEKFMIDDLDYIIICNNDVQILNSDFFSILEEKLNSYDIIAPSIKTLNNIEQNPHLKKSLSKFKKIYYKVYYLNFIIALLLNKILSIRKISNKNVIRIQKEERIFSPHGAFIILNKSYFDKGGYIDTGYFLYGEESSLSAQANILGLSVGFVPDLLIQHWENISTGKRFSKSKFQFQKEAYKYIKCKYPDFY